MPDYSKDTLEASRIKLEKYGTLLGAFDQTTFRTHLASREVTKIGGKALGDGYCVGVGLDWLRRVLHSKADRDLSYLTYSYGALSKEQGTKTHSLDQLKDRTLDTSLRMAKAYYRQTEEMDWVGPKGGSVKSLPADDWKKIAKDLDADFDESRAGRKRKGSKKRFGNLELLLNERRPYARPGLWMDTILDEDVLRIGCGLLAGFHEAQECGHVVAIWRRRNNKDQNDSYYFFDPNLGVFSYNEVGLERALQYLFWREEDDTPCYADCTSLDKQVVSYMVFGPPNVV
jgi:hypothetical protein